MKLHERIQTLQPPLQMGDFETEAEWVAYAFGYASARIEASKMAEGSYEITDILMESESQ